MQRIPNFQKPIVIKLTPLQARLIYIACRNIKQACLSAGKVSMAKSADGVLRKLEKSKS